MDWQTAVVILIILGAAFYVGRRLIIRLSGFSTKGSCETGCGKCDTKTKSKTVVSLKRG